MTTSFRDIINDASAKHGIAYDLITAVICQESRGKPGAYRYEPAFFQQYIAPRRIKDLGHYWPPGVSLFSEKVGRSTSWGLMQVMGQNAREHGFKGEFFTDLCLYPELGVEFGCIYLAECLKKTKTDRDALLRYNGGGDKSYPDKVLAWLGSSLYQSLLS